MKKVLAILLAVCLTVGVLPVYSSAASETEENNSFATAQQINVNAALTGAIPDGGDLDFYTFRLDRDGYIRLSFRHEYVDDSSTLWKLTLFDANCGAINQKTGSGKDVNHTYDPVGLPAGTYYIEVAPYSHNTYSTVPYNLTVNYTPAGDWETEDNGEFSRADQIDVNETVNGSMIHNSDTDLFQFSLSQPGYINLSFDHEYIDDSSTLWYINLYNAEYRLINRYSAAGEDIKNEYGYVGLPAGTYYVGISPYSLNTYSTKPYKMKVNFTPSAEWETEFNDAFDLADAIQTNQMVHGAIMNSSDKDFYRFELPSDGAVILSFAHDYVDNSSVLWYIDICNSEYKLLNEYRSTGDIVDGKSGIIGLPAGTYYVRVRPYSSYTYKTIPYRLTVNYTQSGPEAGPWETEFNDQFADADVIPVNQSVGGSIMSDSDEDFCRFELDEQGPVSITFKHDYLDNSGTVWRVYLYNNALKQISQYDSKGTDTRNLFGPSNLAAGTYYVKITPYSSYTYSTNTYVFYVSAGGESSPAPTSSPSPAPTQSPTPIPTSTPTAKPTTAPPPSSTPDIKALENFLAQFGWWAGGSSYDAQRATASSPAQYGAKNIFEAMLSTGSGYCYNDTLYPGEARQEVWDGKDPWGKWNGYRKTNAQKMEWILSHIFNCSDSHIAALKSSVLKENPTIYYLDGYYYNKLGGVGGGFSASVTNIQPYDGKYRVTYSLKSMYETTGRPRYAIVEWKVIDGQGYWSLHYNTELKDGQDPIKTGGFLDVKEQEYYCKPVLWAVENRITSGIGTGKFGPESSCTRGQIVTFLWRAAGSPSPKTATNPFTDVKPSDYYYKAVLWAVENNITSGIGNGKFGPGNSCTRGQAVTFIWRAAGSPNSATGNSFKDVAAGSYYEKAVNWAVANGITSGTSKTAFSPGKTCTRGQIVTFLYRHYVQATDVKPPKPEDTAYQDILKGLSNKDYFLYDVDSDGIRELIVLRTDETAIRGSVYTVQDGRAIGLMDNETIMSMASVPGGRIGVVSKQGKKYICTRSWNSGYSHPYTSNTGEIKLYTLLGGKLTLSEKVAYRIQSMNSTVPGETDIVRTVNGSGTALDYSQYQEWIESMTWLG
ncbi:S-layer homology domain-containing protein [Acutalibacter muris]|uniref:S-layer homology domain-containing protein n=1 Tax=Acutalibacter muris TaxID=1796620 RepID=A0A1Z2XPR5_9FIRM|nr:S-layer homology domain-containing protein [Acutalibacter muris]ANU52911.1 hypothetical protein A4V00_02120 [Hungateiclostridiaceae bacterium KB18]ASB40416.1 hypothetical protein ADH66_06910 [Acutalibacter muris]QQR29707.1 S-layer homology domain-containing protein [Acutalibacter muris]